jgi:hypothetical protein
VLSTLLQINTSPHTVEFRVTLPTGTPFDICLLKEEIGPTGHPYMARLKAFDWGSEVGRTCTLPPYDHINVALSFSSTVAGAFRVPIQIQLLRPHAWTYPRSYVHTFSITHPYLRDTPTTFFRHFLRNPVSVDTESVLMNVPRIPLPILPCALILSPKSLMLEAQRDSSRVSGFLELTNVSKKPRPYELALSFPFITDIPHNGTLKPGEHIRVVR